MAGIVRKNRKKFEDKLTFNVVGYWDNRLTRTLLIMLSVSESVLAFGGLFLFCAFSHSELSWMRRMKDVRVGGISRSNSSTKTL